MQNDDFEQGLICPSFNSYSSNKLADVAAKVCLEFDNLGLLEEDANDNTASNNHNDDDDEEEFEFVSFQKSDDHVFLDGNQIGPVFPIFNRDLLLNISQGDLTASSNKKAEDDDLPSSSSSDVDELEGVPQGSYCVWIPKGGSSSAQGKCKKSKSTGTSSSRRWSLKDLLKRSNSEGGKDSVVLLTPLSSSSSSSSSSTPRSGHGTDGPKPNPKKGQNAVSLAHEAFYVRNKTVAKDGYSKRRSYLPYRQDLVGFFASVNAMSRTFPAL